LVTGASLDDDVASRMLSIMFLLIFVLIIDLGDGHGIYSSNFYPHHNLVIQVGKEKLENFHIFILIICKAETEETFFSKKNTNRYSRTSHNSRSYTSGIFDRPDQRIRTADFPAGLSSSKLANVLAGPVEIPSKNPLAVVIC
jgi:hypothetical protein